MPYEGQGEAFDAKSDYRRAAEDRVAGFWAAMGWFLATVFSSVALAAASSPLAPDWQAGAYSFGQVAHLQWLLVDTLVVFLVYRCARRRIGFGVAALCLAVAESFSVVGAALDRVHTYHLLVVGVGWWYVVPIVQACLGLGYFLTGARVRLSEWRWERLILRLESAAAPGQQRRPTRRGTRT